MVCDLRDYNSSYGQTGTVLSGFYMWTLKTLNEVRVQFFLHHF